MPATFTASFAARLDRVCAPKVTEAVDGAALAPGHVYIAPGGAAHLEVAAGMTPRCRLVASDPVNGHRPSVDVMFESVATLNRPMTGVILTGMGKDGARGLMAMRDAGEGIAQAHGHARAQDGAQHDVRVGREVLLALTDVNALLDALSQGGETHVRGPKTASSLPFSWATVNGLTR